MRKCNDGYKTQPEKAIGGKRSDTKGVSLFVFKNSCDDLCNSPIKNTHGQDHGAKCKESSIVDVKKNRGHSKGSKSEGCWVCKRGVLCHDNLSYEGVIQKEYLKFLKQGIEKEKITSKSFSDIK